MKKIITAALACAMIASSLCACAQTEQPAVLPVVLPERYILSELGLVTPEKDQATTGLCASYALISACESNLLINGYESVGNLDLSEAHLYYYNYSFEEDRDSGADGYYLTISREESKGNFLQNGSETESLVNLLANGGGPVDETVVEFDPEEEEKSSTILIAADLNGDMKKHMGEYLLTEKVVCSNQKREQIYQPSTVEEMKRAIYDNGAASVGTTTNRFYYHNSDAGVTYFEGIFSEEDVGDHVGHAVCIIGWDDNFSRENFGRNKPEYDGAWLIKDSCKNNYGEYYYWCSYEQQFTSFTTVGLSPRDEYGDILFYDSIKMCANIRSEDEETVAANVFTADKKCSLKAVGVPTSAQRQPVTIEVYRNPDRNAPDSGKLVAELETTIDMPGYHVVDLKKPVKLKEGDTFSILIRYKTENTGVYPWYGVVPVEGDVDEEEKQDFLDYGIEMMFTSLPGQSYTVYNNKWYDTSDPATAELFGLDVTINNFGIKALMEK